MGIGTTPAYTQSTLTLRSTFGGSSSTNLDMVGPGSSGWQNQIRFLASNTAVRHAVVDDYSTGINCLVVRTGFVGSGATAQLRIEGAVDAIGLTTVQTTPGAYGYSLISKVDNGLSKAIAVQVGSGNSWTENFVVLGNGEVRAKRMRIGDNFKAPQDGTNANWKLAVDGDIQAKRVVVQITDWADNVFDENYPLATLEEVEAFIKKIKHLPEIPSEKEVLENGVDTGEMNKLLLKKVEELTLYIIELEKKIEQIKN